MSLRKWFFLEEGDDLCVNKLLLFSKLQLFCLFQRSTMDSSFLTVPRLAEWDPQANGCSIVSLDELENLVGISQASDIGLPPQDPRDRALLSSTSVVTKEELDAILSLDDLEGPSGGESEVCDSLPPSIKHLSVSDKQSFDGWETSVRDLALDYSVAIDRIMTVPGSNGVKSTGDTMCHRLRSYSTEASKGS